VGQNDVIFFLFSLYAVSQKLDSFSFEHNFGK